MSVFEQVKEVVVENLGVAEEEVKMETSFKDDLGADSLDLFELVMALEEEYEIEIPSEELESLLTVEQVVKFIEGKLN